MGIQIEPSEAEEQRTVAAWLDMNRIAWFHVPNEGRHKVQYRRKMAQLGLKAGVSDIIIVDPPPAKPKAPGTVIELKRAKGGRRPTEEQQRWLEIFAERGWESHWCRGSREAIDLLRKLGYGRRRGA